MKIYPFSNSHTFCGESGDGYGDSTYSSGNNAGEGGLLLNSHQHGIGYGGGVDNNGNVGFLHNGYYGCGIRIDKNDNFGNEI